MLLMEDVHTFFGGHIVYVMSIRDEMIAFKTALMQICRSVSM